jgi:hypothetical protein
MTSTKSAIYNLKSAIFSMLHALPVLPVPGIVPGSLSKNALFPYTASMVEGGFGAMLYVTLTMPGTLLRISLASFSRISNER